MKIRNIRKKEGGNNRVERRKLRALQEFKRKQ
jgi:hypothetical protein